MKNIPSLDALVSTILVFGIIALIPIAFNLDFLNPIQKAIGDFKASDLYYSKIQNRAKITIDTNIIIVNIGALDRAGIAEEINRIKERSPKVIGLDCFFRNLKESETDSILSDALKSEIPIVLASELKGYDEDKNAFDSLSKSNRLFLNNCKTGYANVSIDEEEFKTARYFSIKQQVGKNEEFSFPARIVSFFNPDKYKELISRNNEFEFINFKRNIDKYKVIDADKALDPNYDLSFVKGKIVLFAFLGDNLSTSSTEDRYFSPMNEKFVGKSLPDIYGIIVHANAISQILNSDYINETPYWANIIICFFVAYFTIILLKYFEDKLPNLFEPLSVFFAFMEIIFAYLALLFMLSVFQINIDFEEIFLAIGLAPSVFDSYQGSIKPLILEKLNRKAAQ
jgi:CHASE2 domain-containing sensor protein